MFSEPWTFEHQKARCLHIRRASTTDELIHVQLADIAYIYHEAQPRKSMACIHAVISGPLNDTPAAAVQAEANRREQTQKALLT